MKVTRKTTIFQRFEYSYQADDPCCSEMSQRVSEGFIPPAIYEAWSFCPYCNAVIEKYDAGSEVREEE